MIAALTGRLTSKAPTHVTLDVHGVGYDVFIPLSTYYSLPEMNEPAALQIHTYLRDDAIQLFGFLTQVEKDAFALLTTVSGIGPKLALSVLSALSVPDLVSAIRAGDVEKLATVPGIGKKSAGRIALELKDTVERLVGVTPQPVGMPSAGDDRVHADALSALVNLGYRESEVKATLKQLTAMGAPAHSLKDIIRQALKQLARG